MNSNQLSVMEVVQTHQYVTVRPSARKTDKI